MAKDFRALTYLVLDDQKAVTDTVEGQLRTIGVRGEIHKRNLVKDAIETLGIERVEFIISDWNMPEITGFEFLKWVRANEKYKHLPFIILTTIDQRDLILDAIQQGVSNYMTKPWTARDLEVKILEALEKHPPLP